MSQLEVDKIIPQSGTTLTIGDSGDTITFADGAVIGIDTDTLYIDSTNNRVGIGTSSPTSTLEAIGSVKTSDGGTQGISVASTGFIEISRTNGDAFIDFKTSTSEDFDVRIQQVSNGLRFETGGDGSTSERMRIDSSGNVGIGTSSPQYRIESVGTNAGGEIIGLAVRNNATTAGGSASIYFVNSTDPTSAANRTKISSIRQASGHDLAFYTNDGTLTERMRIDSSGNVGIGTSSPAKELHVYASSGESAIQVETAGTDAGLNLIAERASASFVNFGDQDSTNVGQIYYPHSGNYMHFKVGGGERCRVKTDRFLVSSTGNDIGGSNTGGQIETAGTVSFNRSNFVTMFVQRRDSDGSLVDFVQDGTTEGSISVSGATVSYNGFTGTHWSRLADNSKPTILRGTILESLDEMMDWYQVHFTIQEEGKDDVQMEKSYVLQEGESVGDIITYNYEGTDYQATIVKESDVKHSKAKISDTSESKAVYGVFVDWDNDDDTVNDMYVAQTGTFVVRLNSSVTTLNKGDLIQSNGDGTGKVQADDIIRASTVAKVLSTTKIETYDDGSYIVPCSLHC